MLSFTLFVSAGLQICPDRAFPLFSKYTDIRLSPTGSSFIPIKTTLYVNNHQNAPERA